MGIDSPNYPKNMDYLLSIVHPHIAMVLNADLSHSGRFDHLVRDVNPTRRARKLINLIAKEKMKLALSLNQSGVVVVNIDQAELVSELRGVKARQITIGKSVRAQFRIVSARITSVGSRFTYGYQSQKYELKFNDILSPSYSYTFAGAIAVEQPWVFSPRVSLEALSLYHSPAGRMRTFKGIKGSNIIDSTYNANPCWYARSP